MAVPLLFGAVILVATLGVGAPGIDTATGLSAVLARVGVLFLLVAAVHALVLVVLSRDRKQEHEIAATEEQIAASHHPDGG
jgi:preprotein translocase subunit SecG